MAEKLVPVECLERIVYKDDGGDVLACVLPKETYPYALRRVASGIEMVPYDREDHWFFALKDNKTGPQALVWNLPGGSEYCKIENILDSWVSIPGFDRSDALSRKKGIQPIYGCMDGYSGVARPHALIPLDSFYVYFVTACAPGDVKRTSDGLVTSDGLIIARSKEKLGEKTWAIIENPITGAKKFFSPDFDKS